VFDRLIYDRTAVLNGEWWRLLSAHLVHMDVIHLSQNLAGLLLILLITVRCAVSPRAFARAIVLAVLLINSALLLMPWIDWYLGLSGVLYALAVFSIGMTYQRAGLLVCLGLIGTVVWQTISSGEALAEAHLMGLMAGQLALVGKREVQSCLISNNNEVPRRCAA